VGQRIPPQIHDIALYGFDSHGGHHLQTLLTSYQRHIMSKCPYCGDDSGLQIAEHWDITLAEIWPTSRQLKPQLVERLREKYYRALSTAYIGRPWLEPAHKRRRVTLAWLRGKNRRARQPDNLVTGAKPLVDALYQANLVNHGNIDDGLLHLCQARSPDGTDSIHVRIEELL
jgi:hypothetical protein